MNNARLTLALSRLLRLIQSHSAQSLVWVTGTCWLELTAGSDYIGLTTSERPERYSVTPIFSVTKYYADRPDLKILDETQD